MSTLLPTGGSYWNPRCCWWCTTSWVCVAAVRVYDVFRIVMWVVGRAVDAAMTLIFEIVIPAVRIVVMTVLSFLAFMMGLMVGEIRLEWTILFPVFMFVGSWLLWFAWPQIGCFIQNVAWPFFNGLVEAVGIIIPLAVTLINLVIRLWNMWVPIIGFIIYIAQELLVTFITLIVQILGTFDVWALVNSLLEIAVLVAQIVIEIVVAFTVAAPTALLGFTQVIGTVLTALISAFRILTPVIVWLFGTLWTVLEPILMLVVKVVKVVQKHFFLRSLLGVEFHPPLEGMSAASDVDDTTREIWRDVGGRAIKYWDEQSGTATMNRFARVNAYTRAHPIAEMTEYYYLRRAQYAHSDPGSFDSSGTKRKLFEVDDDSLPAGWRKQSPPSEEESPPPPKRSHHQDAMDWLLDAHLDDASDDDGHGVIAEHALHEEMTTKHVTCHSKLCGGEGVQLPHPLKATLADHHRTSPRDPSLGLVGKTDVRAHRRRFNHVVALAHISRRAATHMVDRHWHRGTGEFPRRVAAAWHTMTGHRTLQQSVEHVLTQREHPLDSLHSYVPVLHQWPPFSWMLAWQPEEEQANWHGNWMAANAHRIVLRHNASIATPGTRHLAMEHVLMGEEDDDEQRETVTDDGRHSRREARGIWDLKFRPPPNAFSQAAAQDARLNQPALPVFALLYTQDCFTTRPRNILCLPEMPPQIGCLLKIIFGLFPNKPPVDFCDSEDHCADIGFCLIERPPVTPSLLIILENLPLWLSWCWIWNGIRWVIQWLAIFIPILKGTLQAIGAVLHWIPVLGTLFTIVAGWIPTVVAAQDFVCLIDFFYGFVLVVVIVRLFQMFVLPIIQYLWRSFESGEALFSALRGLEASRLAYLEQSGGRKLIEKFFEPSPASRLPNDPWMSSPLITRVPPRGNTAARLFAHSADDMFGLASMVRAPPGGYTRYPPIVGGGGGGGDNDALPRYHRAELEVRNSTPQIPLLAEIDSEQGRTHAHADDRVSPVAQNAINAWVAALESSVEYFGEPPAPVTLRDVYNHETRFRALIQPAQYSAAWMRHYLGEWNHQREKHTARKPPSLIYQRGMFDEAM